MNIRWLWACVLSFSLCGCAMPVRHGFGADGQPDPEAEDLSAKYDPTTHTLSTRNGEYKIYFPDRPSMIPGQKITYQTRMGTGGGWSMVHNFAKEQTANFQWTGADLKLTAIYWRQGTPRLETARVPMAGGGSMALAPRSRIGWRMAAQNRLSAFESAGTNEDLTNKVKEVFSNLKLTESSSIPIRSPEGNSGREATASNAAGTDVLKLHIYFNQKNRKFYLLLAEGTPTAVNGADGEKFLSSFTYVPATPLSKKEERELFKNPEYRSNQSKAGDFWNSIYKMKEQKHGSKLIEAIKEHGPASPEAQQAVTETFATANSQTMNLTQYAETMKEGLGDEYDVVGKGIGEHAVFGEAGKLERLLDVSSTKPDGTAIAIFLKQDGSLDKFVVHPPYIALTDKLCNAITSGGLTSNDVVQSLYQSFAVPIDGVTKELLAQTVRERLGSDYDAGMLGGRSFEKQGDKRPEDSAVLMIKDLKARKELQILLNSKGQFSDFANK